MDMERKNAKESRSAKPRENDLTIEEQIAKKSNEVEHCLLHVSNTSQSIDKSVCEVKKLDDSNLASVKQKTTRKSVATVIPVLILAIVVTGLAFIPVLLFILNTNVYVRSKNLTNEFSI